MLVQRKGVPTLQNQLFWDESLAKLAPTGDMHLMICKSCGFVQNGAFDPDRVRYGNDYENDQSYSDVFLAHMDAMADRVLSFLPRNGTLIEVGCGQGNFLIRLARRLKGQQPKLYGFDPSYRSVDMPAPVSIFARTFEHEVAIDLSESPDVILSRHVIEHVPDPIAFLSAIRECARYPTVRVFLETPCFEWITSNRVLQDIFYEHVNYFTAETLQNALRRAGFAPAELKHVFDGQYLWAEAVASVEPIDDPTGEASAVAINSAIEFAREIGAQLQFWIRFLADGLPTAIWGAGAKGITFASLVDPRRESINCLIDRNPRKQKAFVPVTGHPIVSPRNGADRMVSRILIMNRNYRAEIEAELAQLGWRPQLIDADMRVA